jgi:hypothetical protein
MNVSIIHWHRESAKVSLEAGARLGDRTSAHALKIMRAAWPHPGRPSKADEEALAAIARIGGCHAVRDVAKAISGPDNRVATAPPELRPAAPRPTLERERRDGSEPPDQPDNARQPSTGGCGNRYFCFNVRIYAARSAASDGLRSARLDIFMCGFWMMACNDADVVVGLLAIALRWSIPPARQA